MIFGLDALLSTTGEFSFSLRIIQGDSHCGKSCYTATSFRFEMEIGTSSVWDPDSTAAFARRTKKSFIRFVGLLLEL